MPEKVCEIGEELATGGAKSLYSRDARQAVKDAHVIYTDTCTSMGPGGRNRQREAVFPPYQVNEKLVSEARKDVIAHALPAGASNSRTD